MTSKTRTGYDDIYSSIIKGSMICCQKRFMALNIIHNDVRLLYFKWRKDTILIYVWSNKSTHTLGIMFNENILRLEYFSDQDNTIRIDIETYC